MTSIVARQAIRILAVVVTLVTLAAIGNFQFSAFARRAPRAAAPLPGLFYTVTGTADNTDALVHGGTGTSADPFQMSSLRGAVLNANTQVSSVTGQLTILVPAGTYSLSVNNPNTPAFTGTIAFPDLEIGSSTNRDTAIVGTGGMPRIQQTIGGNDVITTGFQADGFSPVAVSLTLQNLEITGGGFSGIFTGVDNSSGRSSTTIDNCNVHNNSNPFGQGGGIFNQTGNLTITNSTFSNNTAFLQGGAIFFDLPNSNGSPGTFGNLIVSNTTFSNNTASASSNVAGGGISFSGPNRAENTYSITGSHFVNNHATGSSSKGGAIGTTGSGTLVVSLSRFKGNTATGVGSGIAGQGTSAVNAINNWWGCDDLPGAAGCDSTDGVGVTSDPRLDLVVSATPGCDSTTIEVDFTKNSSNLAVSPVVLDGLTVNFAVVSGPSGAAVSPISAPLAGSVATTTLNASTGGVAVVTATVDNGTEDVEAAINKAVTVTTHPTDQAVCDSGIATFTAAASGSPTPTVQWQVSTNGGGSFSDLSGETANVLTFTATTAQTGNQYRAVFTNTCGSTPATATTTAATLTVNSAPVINTNPVDTTVCDGALATFTASATSSPAASVQWQVSTNGGGSFSDIPGETATTLSFTASSAQSGNKYRAVFTTSCTSATTTAATLTVNASTSATTPTDQTVCQGATATFSTTASGTGPFHYSWTVDGAPFGGNTASINVPTGSLSTGNHPVTVTVSGSCGSVTKNATLTVNQNTATTKPNDQIVCEGSTAIFTTTASGTAPFSFVWKKGATVLNNGDLGGRVSIVNTATTSTLSIATAVAGDSGAYTVETTGSCSTAVQSASLAVNAGGPTITLNGQTITLWPPNHKYSTINVADLVAGASDACDSTVNLNSVVISSVTSDEVDDSPTGADGATVNDIVIAPNCKSVQLRAERDGNLNGRVYTITFKVTNSIGHVTTATAKVTVPTNQSGAGAVDDGPHYTVNGSCP